MTDEKGGPVIEEDDSEIKVVPDAVRDVWLTNEQRAQPTIRMSKAELAAFIDDHRKRQREKS